MNDRAYASGKMLAHRHDGVGLVTFNQPEKRNAMSVEMWDGLAEILTAWQSDDAVRVVVLRGAGNKAFVSGADISQFATNRSDADAQREYDKLTSAGRRQLAAYPKPVIAHIQGFCLGGGLGIAMQADLRIAAEGATFGIPAAKLGIAYGFDMVRRLVSLVGQANARMLLFTGERIDANEALRIGLVNRVVPVAAIDDVVTGLARGIAGNAPLSVRGMKLIVGQALLDAGDRDMAAVDQAVATCFDSADYREGRTAFMEKRPPAFHGE
ncbi:MAG: enoyl-CoA hydratase/isomerase family protein [Gemmatimonadaceae bacterium]|nr:enoyl-CoA hydratase/isomerase family protein [Acetobacteraceae bacterium]